MENKTEQTEQTEDQSAPPLKPPDDTVHPMPPQNINMAREQQIRQDSANLVLGRVLGSFISDLQAQAGEIAVLSQRLTNTPKE